MVVDLPFIPEEGMGFDLSPKDINRYIALVKAADYPSEWGVDKAPDCYELDDEGFWQDLYVDTVVSEVNLTWDEDEEAYLPQVVIDVPIDDEEDESLD